MSDIYEMAIDIGRQIDAQAKRMENQGATLEAQLDNVNAVIGRCMTPTHLRLLDLEHSRKTRRYVQYAKKRP